MALALDLDHFAFVDVPRDEGAARMAQVARDIGWLEGFGATLWALCEMQSKAIVSDETCAMYDNCVARLRENVLDVSLPSGEVSNE